MKNFFFAIFAFLMTSCSTSQKAFVRCPSSNEIDPVVALLSACRPISKRAEDFVLPDISFLKSSPELEKARAQKVTWTNKKMDQTFGSSIVAEEDKEFQTMRIFGVAGRIPKVRKGDPPIQARMLCLHGGGADIANSDGMRWNIRLFSELGGKVGSPLAQVKTLKHYVRIAAEAIDGPGHGVGPSLEGFETVDAYADWLGRYLIEMKRQTPDLPLFVLTRSSTAAAATMVNHRYPGLIDAIIAMSPTAPGEPELLAKEVENARRDSRVYGFEINETLMSWVSSMLLQVKWTPEFFGGLKTLFLMGDKDGQVLPEEKKLYQDLARQSPCNLKYIEIKNAGHDVLNVNRTPKDPFDVRTAGMQAFDAVYDFIYETLNSTR